MTDPEELWAGFSRDPRDPAHAALRASDADRDVVHRALAEAFADGRLRRDELDARTAATQDARTLGELIGPLEGLVPTARSGPARSRLTPAQLDQRAVAAWRQDRREALWGLISVSAIVWTIWLVTSGVGSFPWPAFVSLAAALNLGRIQFQREQVVESERRKLEKKERKELERRRREEGEEP